MKILIHILLLPLLLCPLQAELLFGEEPSEEKLDNNGFEIKAHLDAIPKSMRIRCNQLIQNQNQDGSYKPPGNGEKINAIATTYQSGSYADIYRTGLNTLILETYYRSLSTK